jgi:hypothetical protein
MSRPAGIESTRAMSRDLTLALEFLQRLPSPSRSPWLASFTDFAAERGLDDELAQLVKVAIVNLRRMRAS